MIIINLFLLFFFRIIFFIININLINIKFGIEKYIYIVYVFYFNKESKIWKEFCKFLIRDVNSDILELKVCS